LAADPARFVIGEQAGGRGSLKHNSVGQSWASFTPKQPATAGVSRTSHRPPKPL
jgi:hypothetical protein